MKPNLFTITINIDDFIEYIKNYCDKEQSYYNDIDVSMILHSYFEEKDIIYKCNSKFNGESFYNYISDILDNMQKNKDILDEIEYHKQRIEILQKSLS